MLTFAFIFTYFHLFILFCLVCLLHLVLMPFRFHVKHFQLPCCCLCLALLPQSHSHGCRCFMLLSPRCQSKGVFWELWQNKIINFRCILPNPSVPLVFGSSLSHCVAHVPYFFHSFIHCWKVVGGFAERAEPFSILPPQSVYLQPFNC